MTMIGASAASGRRGGIAALIYFAIVAAALALAGVLVADLMAKADALSAAKTRLAELDGRTRAGAANVGGSDPQAAGSPFLEGETVTVAGAALQQRVNAAVDKAGGAVRSSQIELDGPQARDGYVTLTANVEIAQPDLQSLLYDLEAGMPYLFVDTLAVQAPQTFGEAENAKMRVVLGVTGQWQAKP